MTAASETYQGIRLAELIAVLSLGTDLGMGQPMEHVLRQCLISLRLADRLGARLGLSQQVRDSVEQTFERWDGKGIPRGAKREEIHLTSRLVALADVVEVFYRAGGTEAAVAVAGERRGTQFDPDVVDVFTAEAESLFSGLDEASGWDAVIGAEPALSRRLADADFEAALEAIADFIDVKSPFTIGHSRGVADLAGNAARALGLGGQAATVVRRAVIHQFVQTAQSVLSAAAS